MTDLSRRNALFTMAGGAALAASAASGAELAQPRRPGFGGDDPGPRNAARDSLSPDMLNQPVTDSGTLPNLKFSFADAPTKEYPGGWTRQVTVRELGVSKNIAGVDMRLNSGGVRELHWHKESEWAFMLYGNARITAVGADGKSFVDDVGPGDLWYFPSGVPHSIQGLGPDGCEFLLAFDDGGFDEDSTFLLTDWFNHVPPALLAKNFQAPAEAFAHLPKESERYIFPVALPPSDVQKDRIPDTEMVGNRFSHRMMAQEPIKTPHGTVRITDSNNFPAAKTIAAALVEIEPGGIRELHWHPNTDEWQYYIGGQARMGVFAANAHARTFDFAAGDVGYVPFAMGHYIENTGSTTLRFLEMFKSSYYADISLNQWLALTPPELVQGHLNLDPQKVSFRKDKLPVV